MDEPSRKNTFSMSIEVHEIRMSYQKAIQLFGLAARGTNVRFKADVGLNVCF
jgi:hypothetical protein